MSKEEEEEEMAPMRGWRNLTRALGLLGSNWFEAKAAMIFSVEASISAVVVVVVFWA